MTPLKIRKLLIAAGVFSSEIGEQINELKKSGKTIPEIQQLCGLSRASVHSYLPYTKTIYNAEELSRNAERIRVFRDRKAAVDLLENAIKQKQDLPILEDRLWRAIVLFTEYPFYTTKGLRFVYSVKGNEMFVSRKEKSITRFTVMLAFKKALELHRMVRDPKQLETFGASYLYPLFIRLHVIMGS